MNMKKTIILLLSLLSLAPVTEATGALPPRERERVARGVALFERGRWSDARNELLRVRRQERFDDESESQRIDYLLAVCELKLGGRDAEAVLARFARRYPESVYNNDLRFALGSLLSARGDYDRAYETLTTVDYRALDRSQRDEYDLKMGYLEFGREDYDAALGYFDRIGARSDYFEQALYYKSYIAYVREDYARASSGFERLLQSDAYGEVAPYYLLQIRFRQGDYRYVVERGEELIRRTVPHRQAELCRVMAESWFRLGEYGKPLDYLDAYVKAGGEMGRNENYLYGFSLYRTARYADAADYLRKACGPDDALTQNASYHLADCCLRSGEKERAMQSFAMASNADFDPAIAEEALFNYGKLQYELGGGRFNEAIRVLNRYVERYPSSERIRTVRALQAAAYYNSRSYEEAYRIISAYPDPDGELLAARQKIAYFRGVNALEQGDASAATEALAEAARIGVSPKYAALASFWQGELAYRAGDYEGAAALYERYRHRAPKEEREYAISYYATGYCHFAAENMLRAREDFLKFAELYADADAYRSDALSRLGDTYYADRRFDEALARYEAAAAGTDEAADYARYRRALTLGVLGRVPEKIAVLRRIVATGTGDCLDEAIYELGRTYVATERYREGVAVLEPFVENNPQSPLRTAALSELGLACLNLGDRRKSLDYYDRVVKAAPHSSDAKDALQGIRDIYVSQGDAGGYFDYAAKSGVESDLGAVSRDSLSFAAARRIYLSGKPDAAAKSLRSYLESYPKGYYTADALYYLGDCYRQSGDRTRMIETLAALADAGTTRYTERALEMLSGMTFADKRYDEAAVAYRRLADLRTTAAEKGEAMTGYVRATLAAGDEERTLAMAEDVASFAAAGDVAWRESQFARAEIVARRGDTEEALRIYKVLSANVQTAQGAESAYRVIEAAYRAGDTAGTEKLVFEFSDKRTPHAYWLAKSYLLLGDIYVRNNDLFQARATYQSIVDGYTPDDDGIVAEAKEKIRKLS